MLWKINIKNGRITTLDKSDIIRQIANLQGRGNGNIMTFGEKLIQIRKDNNLSQERMAELLDVSRQSISKWESDKSYPETKRLIFICEHFGVSMDYLLLNDIKKHDTNDKDQYQSSIKNSFINWMDNLSVSQRKLLYVLAVSVLVLFAVLMTYCMGKAIGKFAYNIQH